MTDQKNVSYASILHDLAPISGIDNSDYNGIRLAPEGYKFKNPYRPPAQFWPFLEMCYGVYCLKNGREPDTNKKRRRNHIRKLRQEGR